MKKIYSASMNPAPTLVEGKLVPGAEVNIMLTEPDYVIGRLGDMPSVRPKIEVCRFWADPHRLREMAKGFTEMADESEKLLAQGIAAAQTDAEPPSPPASAN
jgi:hypothetical protein